MAHPQAAQCSSPRSRCPYRFLVTAPPLTLLAASCDLDAVERRLVDDRRVLPFVRDAAKPDLACVQRALEKPVQLVLAERRAFAEHALAGGPRLRPPPAAIQFGDRRLDGPELQIEVEDLPDD
jgi:hypothetical protein